MKFGARSLSAVAAIVLSASCSAESKLNVVIEEGANAPHPNIPEVPQLPAPPQPVQHPDGVHTVWGVRHVAARNWGHNMRVRGFIVGVYEPMVPGTNPPRRCREQDRCLEEKPHIFIADTPDETDHSRWMQVTGYANYQAEIDEARRLAARQRPSAAPSAAPSAGASAGASAAPQGGGGVPTDFDRGAKVVISGALRRRAANGQADSTGLLEYQSHVTEQPAPPPPNARH